jgi:hypothetical protein
MRHVLDAADEARSRALQLAHRLDALHPLRQPRHHHLQLEPRETCAQADVLPDAEAEVRVRLAVDAERERVVEDGFVAIRGWIEETEVLTRGDHRPVQLDVLGRRPAELDDGARPADDLLRSWPRHAGRIALELGEFS